MAILSCLAAVLLLLIASFTLMEDINSSMSSSSIWQELETGSSYTPSITVHSNMTSLRNNDLLRERAVHRLRTGVYATEVKLFKGNPLVANQWLITTTCCATSKVQDYCQKVPVGLFITRPSVMEVSPWTFGLTKSILPIDHRIAGYHRIAGDHRIAGIIK